MIHIEPEKTIDEAMDEATKWYLSTWKVWLLKGFSLLLVLLGIYMTYMVQLPMYKVESIKFIPDTVRPGEVVKIEFELGLNKQCGRREITQMLIGPLPSTRAQVVGRHVGTVGKGPNLPTYTETSFRIPWTRIDGLPFESGEYQFEWTSEALCKPLDHHVFFIRREDQILTVK